MNREQRLNQFVDQNLGPLTGTWMTKHALKKLRQAFFEKHHLSALERFTSADVAAAVVKKVVAARPTEPPANLLHECQRIPYVVDLLGSAEIGLTIELSLPAGDSVLTPEDIRSIHQHDHLSRIEQEFEAKAKADAERFLQEERQRLGEKEEDVRSELKRLKKATSALDGAPPEIDLEEEAAASPLEPAPSSQPWWDELGLEADPFPTDRGLVGIPEEKYDDVFVETSFLRKYLTMVEKPQEFLGKTIVLAGEFGTGKTTLFEICERRLGMAGVLPVRVIMNPSANVGGLMVDFLAQVGGSLCDATVQTGGVDVRREIGSVDSLNEMGQVIDAAKQAGVSSRLVIFVDGLHKGHKYTNETFEFLQQLQNTQEFLEARGFQIGTIVAGSANWARQFEETPSLSGSIHHIDAIPPIAEAEAVEAAVRRIVAFARKGASQPPIRREPLQLAYRALAGRTDHVTFRAFLNHIHNRLRARQFDELGLSVEVHLETVELVQSTLLQSSLRDGLLSLQKKVEDKPRARRAIPKVLTAVYSERGVREGSGLFNQHIRIMHLLARAGLISKRLRGEDLEWRISESLGGVLQNLYSDHQVLPVDALACILVEQSEAVRQEVHRIYEGGASSFAELEELVRKSWPEMTDLAIRLQSDLKRIEATIEKRGPTHVDIQHIQDSTRGAMAGVAWAASGAEQCPDSGDFAESWAAPENADDFARIAALEVVPQRPTEAFGLYHAHAGLMADAGQLIVELTRGEALARIAKRQLTNEDRQAIHSARLSFAKGDYRSSIAACYDYLEAKIRRVVFSRLSLTLGSGMEKAIPKDIATNLQSAKPRGHARAKRHPDINFLYDVSRSEYAKIIFSKSVLRVLGLDEKPTIEQHRLRDAIELTFSIGDRDAHGDRAEFFREHATEIGDCIKAMPRLCEIFNQCLSEMFTAGFIRIENAPKGYAFAVAKIPDGLKAARLELTTYQIEQVIKAVLERLDRREYALDHLPQFVSIPGIAAHQVLPVLITMQERELLVLRHGGTDVAMGPKGRDKLNRLRNSPQTTLDASLAQ